MPSADVERLDFGLFGSGVEPGGEFAFKLGIRALAPGSVTVQGDARIVRTDLEVQGELNRRDLKVGVVGRPWTHSICSKKQFVQAS